MTHIVSISFLRRALSADAAASGATGLLLTFGAGLLAEPLGLPEPLLRAAGQSLLPFALLLAWLATRERLWRPAAWAVVAYNALWVADSVVLLASGWVAPTVLGQAFVIAQALVVAALAALQAIGLQRSPATA